jgi:hypothetical protein
MSHIRVKALSQKWKATHFIHLPLVTQFSKPQIESSLLQLTKDISDVLPSSESCIPANAVTSLPGIKVTLETLRHTDVGQVQTIQEWLRDLDIPTMLATTEMSANPQSQ